MLLVVDFGNKKPRLLAVCSLLHACVENVSSQRPVLPPCLPLAAVLSCHDGPYPDRTISPNKLF